MAGIEKFFDILEEVNKEEQTTIETLLALSKVTRSEQSRALTEQKKQLCTRYITPSRRIYPDREVSNSYVLCKLFV